MFYVGDNTQLAGVRKFGLTSKNTKETNIVTPERYRLDRRRGTHSHRQRNAEAAPRPGVMETQTISRNKE
jgi:hypothetical protein